MGSSERHISFAMGLAARSESISIIFVYSSVLSAFLFMIRIFTGMKPEGVLSKTVIMVYKNNTTDTV